MEEELVAVKEEPMAIEEEPIVKEEAIVAEELMMAKILINKERERFGGSLSQLLDH